MPQLSPAEEARRRRLALILFSLIAGTLIVLGLISLISGESTGKTRAGVIVHTIGPRARWAGAASVACASSPATW